MKHTVIFSIIVLTALSVDAKRLFPLSPSQFKGGMDANGFGITNAADFTTASGVSLTGLATQVENSGTDTNGWNITTNAAAIGVLESGTNNWNTAYGWGDHAAGGYLTSYTETDPAWNSGTGAIYTAIGLKFDTSSTNLLATAAQGVLADSAVQQGDDPTFGTMRVEDSGSGGSIEVGQVVIFESDGQLSFNDGTLDTIGPAAVINVGDQLGPFSAMNRQSSDFRYVQPQVASDFLTLDREIESWEDIGITYSNAVTLNSPITITNDSVWTGWTTDGTLSGGVILLMHGDYLQSPVQSNGVSRVEYESYSHMSGTSGDESIYTNGVEYGAAPYRGVDGQWRMVGSFFAPPGTTEGLYVSNATIIAYEDVSEAAMHKDVSNLGVMDEPVALTDVANKRYVDDGDTSARTYTDTELTAYALDADKTVRGSQLRLGNMWVVSPADTSGQRFIVSGGEISGTGELIGTTNEFVISKNGYPLLEFTSDSSGLFITNHTIGATSSNVTVNLGIATNGVVAAPYAEWAEDLVVAEWTRVQTYATETYPTVSSDTYTLEFTVPATNGGYFRAMQDIGESVMTVKADVLDLGAAHLVFNSISNTTTYAATLSWDATNKVFIVTEEAL